MALAPERTRAYPDFEHPLEDSDQFAGVQRMHGGGIESMFPEGGSPKRNTPWPRAARSKTKPLYQKGLVHEALTSPRETVSMDPRALHATQPSVTEGGVRYYMDERYAKTGRTFADQGNVGNRNPVVYSECGEGEGQGRNLLLSGHHRATAALLKGGQFEAIHVKEPC